MVMRAVRLFRVAPATVAASGISIAAHLFTAWIVIRGDWVDTYPFEREALSFITLEVLLTIASFVVPSRRQFRALVAVRLTVLLIVLRLIASDSPAIDALQVSSLVIELAAYEDTRPAAVMSGLVVMLSAVVVVLNLSGTSANPISHLLYLSIIVGTVGVAAIAAFWYRESLVEERATNASLNDSLIGLAGANRAFQVYAGNVETKSAERERQRITRELHDVVGYTLTNVVMMMNACKVLLRKSPNELYDVFDEIRTQSERALQETRETLYRLRDVRDAAPEGLRAIVQLVSSVNHATNLDVELNMGNLPWSLGRDVDACIYRIAQEGMTNAFRHGKATRVRIFLWREPSELRISVWDNGRGIQDEISDGIGLSGMRERLATVGGTINPHNTTDGFQLDATIPFGPARTS